MDVDVVVIGSGAGGLTAATALARCGKSVAVFEQHYLPGGWCHSFPLGGYQFSPGVHYVGQFQPGGMMRNIYEGLGLSKHLKMLELNADGYDHARLGDVHFDMPRGRERLEAALCHRFPAEANGIRTYLDLCHAVASGLNSLDRVKTPWDALKISPKVAKILRHGLGSLQAVLDHCTSNKALQGVLAVQSGNHGLPADMVPFAMHAAIQAHYFDGGWYPKGGAKSIPRAYLKELRAHGGTIKVSTPVSKILVENGTAIGVRLGDGTEVRCETVISNADVAITYGKLLDTEDVPSKVRKKLDKTTWSGSALSLFFAADIDADTYGLDSGNYWVSDKPEPDRFFALRDDADVLRHDRFPAYFLTCTTLKDPTKYKPKKGHTFEMFTLCEHDAFQRWAHTEYGSRPEDYDAMKEALTERMLDTLNDTLLPGIKDKVVFNALGTPLTNVHYVASTRGNLYGTEKTLGQIGPFGWQVGGPIRNLRTCGASTMMHGVAGATMTGLLAAKETLDCRMKELFRFDEPPLVCLPCDHPERWPGATPAAK